MSVPSILPCSETRRERNEIRDGFEYFERSKTVTRS